MPEVLKNLLYVIYIIVTKANKFFDKNKSRTKTGRMYKKTIVLGIIFAVLTVIVGIVCLF